jgi:hypothetical protein
MVRIAANDRMVLELAEVTRESDVLRARDVLVAEEQHAVLEQQRANLGDETGVSDAAPRLTLDNSAPMAQVSRSTLMEPRVVMLPQPVRLSCRSSFPVLLCAQIAKIDEPVVLRASKVAVSLRRVLQFVALVDLDPDSPRGDVAEELLQSAFFSTGRRCSRRAPAASRRRSP